MSRRSSIQVFEFDKLYYPGHPHFHKAHWEALCQYLEIRDREGEARKEYYRILNKGVQFTHFVGVIQTRSLTIEILPKAERQASDESKTGWRNVLLQMLSECRLLRIHHVENAFLNLRHHSILDIYLRLFLDETEGLLHEGLLKKYRQWEGNSPALKGNLLFAKQASQNLVHAERFYVRHTAYDQDNLQNQLLLKTLRLIPQINMDSEVNGRVQRLLLNFPEVRNCTAIETSFQRLRFDRKTERYREALLIAKMLLLNYRPDLTGGGENVMAILFDMNKLWEEWVYRRLKKEEGTAGATVHRQQSEDFWQSHRSPRPRKVRPDIVIKKGSNTIVVDTKWKITDTLIPDDNDLKQMYVYNLFWNCDRSVLLYPAMQSGKNEGYYADHQEKSKWSKGCTVRTVTVLDEYEKLDANFGARLLRDLIA